jgi:uncharacterized protein YhbP (UPF0306 family)
MIEARIVRFLRRHHLLTLATTAPVYCSHAFYCYDAVQNLFVFAAAPDTHHARQMISDCRVAFGIALESRMIGRLQGVQGTGRVRAADGEARKAYLRRFPYAAIATDLTLWILEPDGMKLTDNTLGFGKKITWKRQE